MKKLITILAVSLLLLSGSLFGAYEGEGTSAIAPTSINAGSTGNHVTVTVTTGVHSYKSGGVIVWHMTDLVDDGWTVPQKTDSTKNGYITYTITNGNITSYVTNGESVTFTVQYLQGFSNGELQIHYYGVTAGATAGSVTPDIESDPDPDNGLSPSNLATQGSLTLVASTPTITPTFTPTHTPTITPTITPTNTQTNTPVVALVLAKAANVASVAHNDTFTWSLSLTATGAHNFVGLWDTVPDGFEWTGANPTPVATVVTGTNTMLSFTWSYLNNESKYVYIWGAVTDNASPENITNVARADSVEQSVLDEVSSAVGEEGTPTSTPTPKLTLLKSANVANAVEDVTFTWSLSLTATGAITNADVWDSVPNGFEWTYAAPTPGATVVTGSTTMLLWEFASIADGASEYIYVAGAVTNYASPENVTNLARAIADNADILNEVSDTVGYPATNTPTDTLTPTPTDTPAMAIEKSVNIDTITLGNTYTYVISVSPNGNAHDVEVYDTLPWNLDYVGAAPTPAVTVGPSGTGNLLQWNYVSISGTPEAISIYVKMTAFANTDPSVHRYTYVTNQAGVKGTGFDAIITTPEELGLPVYTATLTPTLTPTETSTAFSQDSNGVPFGYPIKVDGRATQTPVLIRNESAESGVASNVSVTAISATPTGNWPVDIKDTDHKSVTVNAWSAVSHIPVTAVAIVATPTGNWPVALKDGSGSAIGAYLTGLDVNVKYIADSAISQPNYVTWTADADDITVTAVSVRALPDDIYAGITNTADNEIEVTIIAQDTIVQSAIYDSTGGTAVAVTVQGSLVANLFDPSGVTPVAIDTYNGLKIIDGEHMENHKGNLYHFYYQDDDMDSADANHLIIIYNGSSEDLHFRPVATSSAALWGWVYRNVTSHGVGAGGNSITVHCRNDSVAGTSDVKAYYGYATSAATVWDGALVLGGTGPFALGGQTANENEYIIPTGESLMILVDPIGDNMDVMIKGTLYNPSTITVPTP